MKRLVLLSLLVLGCEQGGPACGDGEVLIPEQCDDANVEDGDGCSALCEIEPLYMCEGIPSQCTLIPVPGRCGDGEVNTGEECDDGAETDACDGDCTFSACGDGIMNLARGEECDDDNTDNGDGCTNRCVREPESCGNARCDEGETCVNCLFDCADVPPCRDCVDRDADGALDSACGGLDCNDFDDTVHPGATEVSCNRIDEDCEPVTRDALDEDDDGSSCNFDCDDNDPNRNPLYYEQCANSVDDDCNPETIDVLDRDGDGFACDVDCNDFNATMCPSCGELCANGLNDDCDFATLDLYDTDEDGVTCDLDCNELDIAINPTRREICNNGIDDDCDAATLDIFDGDGDGDPCTTDCDDRDERRATSFAEDCGNGVDDDCNEATLELEDADGDGFVCDLDCDDTSAAVVPDADHRCGPRFSYRETFEEGPGGWSASGVLSSWEHGTPNKTFIPRAAEGDNAWVTNLDGDYNDGEISRLTSPSFDLSGIAGDPLLSFSHIFSTEECCDHGWVEVSTNGGTTWRKLGAFGEGTNWYNADFDDWWEGASGSAGTWRRASHVLTDTAGFSDVRVRFVFEADGSGTDAGFGVDNVVIDSQIIDLSVVTSGIPASSCASAEHPVVIRVVNTGQVPITSFDAQFRIDTEAPVVETVSRTILPGASFQYTFTARANASLLGAHVIQSRVTASGDDVRSNDSLARFFEVDDSPFVVVGPGGYDEDFEVDGAGWAGRGVMSSWEHGAPTTRFIPNAASGVNVWATNLTGEFNEGENSQLTSPCFDLTALGSDPVLSFSHLFQYGFVATSYMEYLTSDLGDWVLLGSASTGINWYNSEWEEAWSETSGPAGVWESASHPLEGAGGQPIVRVRYVLMSDGGTDDGAGIDRVMLTP